MQISIVSGESETTTQKQRVSGPSALWVGGLGSAAEGHIARLVSHGYAVDTATSYREARALLCKGGYCFVLFDLSSPRDGSLKNMRRLKDLDYRLEIVAVNGEPTIERAVETIKAGAWDYLPYPLCGETLIEKISLMRRQCPMANLASHDPIVDYIRTHATAIGTRAEVASRFGLSSDTVSSRVRAMTGKTFTALLHECRLEQARDLLVSTVLNVSQVAARAGFSTPQHFSRIFRQNTGLSPARYRLQERARKSSAG
jgi:AraC-like DNA-binding protein